MVRSYRLIGGIFIGNVNDETEKAEQCIYVIELLQIYNHKQMLFLKM